MRDMADNAFTKWWFGEPEDFWLENLDSQERIVIETTVNDLGAKCFNFPAGGSWHQVFPYQWIYTESRPEFTYKPYGWMSP